VLHNISQELGACSVKSATFMSVEPMRMKATCSLRSPGINDPEVQHQATGDCNPSLQSSVHTIYRNACSDNQVTALESAACFVL